MSLELSLQRRQTTAFIAADPLLLMFVHFQRVPTPAGGFKDVMDGNDSLVVRVIPGSPAEEVRVTSGKMVRLQFTVMAEWDADLRRGDKFFLQGVEYVIDPPIAPEHTDNAYFKKGIAVRRSDV